MPPPCCPGTGLVQGQLREGAGRPQGVANNCFGDLLPLWETCFPDLLTHRQAELPAVDGPSPGATSTPHLPLLAAALPLKASSHAHEIPGGGGGGVAFSGGRGVLTINVFLHLLSEESWVCIHGNPTPPGRKQRAEGALGHVPVCDQRSSGRAPGGPGWAGPAA